MNEQNNPILEVKNLRVSYHTYAGEVKAVRGVQFSLEKGQALAIVGESGCGKSVTAKSIMGLIKAPQGEIKENSEILYHGENILKYNKKQWQHYKGGECAIIFQDALASLNPTMRVGKQKNPDGTRSSGFWIQKSKENSTLGELRRAASCLQAVFLSFLHSRVTGQEASGFQRGTEFGVDAQQSAGNAMTDGAGLAGHAAALDGADDIDLADQIGRSQRLTDDHLQGIQAEIIIDITAVDGDGAGAALIDADTGNGGFTTAGAVLILSLALVHSLLPPD